MATHCRICHPEQFNTKDQDPQSREHFDTELQLETSDSDEDKSSGNSSSNDDNHEDNTDNAKGLRKEETEQVTLSSGHVNSNVLNPVSDDSSVHDITKRSTLNRNDKKQHQKRGKRKRGNRNSRKTLRVLMPDHKYYSIIDIVIPHWKCGDKTKLINLGPNTKTKHKEFDIVETVMQNTIAHHDHCESGGGCFDKYNIIKIEKIVQGCAWRKYQARKTEVAVEAGSANEMMLFHGTDAVWEIVSKGFDERFSSTNGQFGAGLYFAQHSSLANQFVYGYFGGNGCKIHHDKNCYICERHLLLCRVTLGNAYQLKTIENMPHPPPGYHSVEALVGEGAFNYPEYVIYRGEQAYPDYLITYKIVKPKKVDYNGKNDSVIEPSRLDVKHQNVGVGYQSPGTGHQSRGVGYQSPGTGHQSRGVGYQSPGTGHQSRGIGYQSPSIGHQSRGVGYQDMDGRGGYVRGNSDRGGDRPRGGDNRHYDRRNN